MSWLEALLLGVVQGLTEFLPISSKSHLALTQHLLGGRADLDFIVLLHLPSLLAVLIAYRSDLARYLRHVLRPGGPGDGPGARREVLFLALATVPAAAAGFLLENRIGEFLQHPAYIGAGLLVTAVILAWSERAAPDRMDAAGMGAGRALGIGIAQAFAVLPGISRSGSTIAGGLLAGLRRAEAVRFSFLLSIPTIGGAILLKFAKGAFFQADWGGVPIAVGVTACFLTSLAAIRLVQILALRRGLIWFATYCAALGLSIVFWDGGIFSH